MLLLELLKEHPIYSSFIFVSLTEGVKSSDEYLKKEYESRLQILRDFFLGQNEKELMSSPSVILSKIRLLKEKNKMPEAYEALKDWMGSSQGNSDVLKIEYVKLLIELGKTQEAVEQISDFLNNLHQSLTRHYCGQCGFNSDDIFWRCPQCREWETIQFRFKI